MKKRILLVDDDPIILQAIACDLREEGCNVTEADRGEAAPYCLILNSTQNN